MIEQERIEKDAHLVALQAYDYQSAYSGYIAGASAERERLKDTRLYSQEVIDSYEEQLKQERNKAIDDCIEMISTTSDRLVTDRILRLESLKH